MKKVQGLQSLIGFAWTCARPSSCAAPGDGVNALVVRLPLLRVLYCLRRHKSTQV